MKFISFPIFVLGANLLKCEAKAFHKYNNCE